MRKLASIQKVINIFPIENADLLEVCQVLGWYVVTKKGDFKLGDLCTYYEVDSFLPIEERYEFLRKNCYRKLADDTEGFRLRTIKLRGQVSQGLILPIDALTCCHEEGDDVTGLLNVIKYEPPLPTDFDGELAGPWPGFLPHTDETRIQGHPGVLERHRGKTFIAREKLDGTSCTIYHNNVEFGVCGRTLNFLEKEGNTFWSIVNRYDLKRTLPLRGNIALQGEVIGEGLQGNKYKMKGQDIYIFNVFDIDKQEYLNDSGLMGICNLLGLKMAPTREVIVLNHTVDEIVTMSNFKSILNPNATAEGLVFRPLNEERDVELGRLSFKAISKEFLLKYDE